MSAVGQKPNLPHCNSNGRFTSINGHYAMRFKVMRFAAFTAPKSPTEMALTIPDSIMHFRSVGMTAPRRSTKLDRAFGRWGS